jgi:hypothetical protein
MISGFNVFDFFILSGALFDQAIMSVDMMHDGDNLSDHEPVIRKMCLNSKYFSLSDKVHVERIAWYKATVNHIADYKCALDSLLSDIEIPVGAITCHNPLCTNLEHNVALNTYANCLTDACVQSAKSTIPHTGWAGKKPIPGWTEFVEPVRQRSMFWHKIWIDCGRPRTGTVADNMRHTRASYHYAVRSVKRNEHIIRQRFAEAVLNGNGRNLLSEVRKSTYSAISSCSYCRRKIES